MFLQQLKGNYPPLLVLLLIFFLLLIENSPSVAPPSTLLSVLSVQSGRKGLPGRLEGASVPSPFGGRPRQGGPRKPEGFSCGEVFGRGPPQEAKTPSSPPRWGASSPTPSCREQRTSSPAPCLTKGWRGICCL